MPGLPNEGPQYIEFPAAFRQSNQHAAVSLCLSYYFPSGLSLNLSQSFPPNFLLLSPFDALNPLTNFVFILSSLIITLNCHLVVSLFNLTLVTPNQTSAFGSVRVKLSFCEGWDFSFCCNQSQVMDSLPYRCNICLKLCFMTVMTVKRKGSIQKGIISLSLFLRHRKMMSPTHFPHLQSSDWLITFLL